MISRRKLLATGLLGGAAAAAGGWKLSTVPTAAAALPASNPLRIPPLYEGTVIDGVRVFDLGLQKGVTQLLSGHVTKTLGINGSYLGPTLRMHDGEKVRLNVTNRIGEPTTLHWHGLHIPAKEDGGPHQVIQNGATWSPSFEVKQKAATYWYHPHLMGKTGEHVYNGLAGLMIIDDKFSGQHKLPNEYGVDDIPLIIQDRRFNSDNSLAYLSSMHDVMMGMQGNTILVNGTVNPHLIVSRPTIQFRILNGSNARFYNLRFSDNRSFHQIGTDGGYLESPVPIKVLSLAPGERAMVVVDVSDGEPVRLIHEPGTEMGPGMRMGRRNRGAAMEILQIRPTNKPSVATALPQKLVDVPNWDEASATRTRRFLLQMTMGPMMMSGGGNSNRFSINGKSMAIDRIDETIKLGDTEIWELVNRSPMAHPFHIHDIQFRILDRNGSPPPENERGLKDTVVVNSGETVRVISSFDDYADPDIPYMYHCHILEHEDAGMMGQFLVVS